MGGFDYGISSLVRQLLIILEVSYGCYRISTIFFVSVRTVPARS